MTPRTRTVFTTAAILSLCGLLAGCADDEEGPLPADVNNAVSVTVDDGKLDTQRKVSKVDALSIKQSTR